MFAVYFVRSCCVFLIGKHADMRLFLYGNNLTLDMATLIFHTYDRTEHLSLFIRFEGKDRPIQFLKVLSTREDVTPAHHSLLSV